MIAIIIGKNKKSKFFKFKSNPAVNHYVKRKAIDRAEFKEQKSMPSNSILKKSKSV